MRPGKRHGHKQTAPKASAGPSVVDFFRQRLAESAVEWAAAMARWDAANAAPARNGDSRADSFEGSGHSESDLEHYRERVERTRRQEQRVWSIR